MEKNSTLENIFKFVGFLVIASLALKVLFALVGGVFSLAFSYGIPLLIAIGVVKWLTNWSQNKR